MLWSRDTKSSCAVKWPQNACCDLTYFDSRWLMQNSCISWKISFSKNDFLRIFLLSSDTNILYTSFRFSLPTGFNICSSCTFLFIIVVCWGKINCLSSSLYTSLSSVVLCSLVKCCPILSFLSLHDANTRVLFVPEAKTCREIFLIGIMRCIVLLIPARDRWRSEWWWKRGRDDQKWWYFWEKEKKREIHCTNGGSI